MRSPWHGAHPDVGVRADQRTVAGREAEVVVWLCAEVMCLLLIGTLCRCSWAELAGEAELDGRGQLVDAKGVAQSWQPLRDERVPDRAGLAVLCCADHQRQCW